jgi:hypothetical protein
MGPSAAGVGGLTFQERKERLQGLAFCCVLLTFAPGEDLGRSAGGAVRGSLSLRPCGIEDSGRDREAPALEAGVSELLDVAEPASSRTGGTGSGLGIRIGDMPVITPSEPGAEVGRAVLTGPRLPLR